MIDDTIVYGFLIGFTAGIAFCACLLVFVYWFKEVKYK